MTELGRMVTRGLIGGSSKPKRGRKMTKMTENVNTKIPPSFSLPSFHKSPQS